MALNIKSLLPCVEHPEVTNPLRETQTEQGACEQDHAFDPKQGARERGLMAWQEHQTKTRCPRRLNKTQLLDVL